MVINISIAAPRHGRARLHRYDPYMYMEQLQVPHE
jgi:hypothetical protein